MAARPSFARLAAAGLLLTGLALAGCGSSTTVVTDRSAATTAASTTAATSATSQSSTATSSPGTTNTVGAGVPRCTAAVLTAAVIGQQGAAGHGEIGIALRNAGARPCHTFGYPGVLFLSRTGAALPTSSQRVTRDYFGSAAVTGLTLAPGAQASFRLGVTHIGATSSACTSAAAVQVIPPDDTHTLRVRIPGGGYECGVVTVSPLRPGTSAFV